jgi:hypothetical protein
MCQGGCVKESSSQGQFPSRGSGGLADRPLGDQAAAGDWEGIVVDRRQLVPGRKRDDQITMTLQRAPCHDQAAICRAGEGRDGALDLAGIAYMESPATSSSGSAAEIGFTACAPRRSRNSVGEA